MYFNTRLNYVFSKIPGLDIFSLNKISKLGFLNKIGIQGLRVWLAEKRYNIRRDISKKDTRGYINTLNKEGIICIPNFLPTSEFSILEKECKEALSSLEPTITKHDGPNTYVNFRHDALKKFENISKALDNDRILNLFRAAERRNFNEDYFAKHLTCLTQGVDNGKKDPETNLHEDTFFNTFKAWLYITDVDYPSAPFVFVPGSHNNKNAERYSRSNAYVKNIGKKSTSRRISDEELKELGLKETNYVANKNTLVIANTLGFHRRLRGEAGQKRVALAYSTRFNPFI